MQTPHCTHPDRPIATLSIGRSEDRQFARFLDAADRLGESLDSIFDVSFEKLVSQSPPRPETLQHDMARLDPISGHPMPLPPEQEVLCTRLEKGESCPEAANVIRQQAHEIADLSDRLSRAYAVAPDASPWEITQEVIAT